MVKLERAILITALLLFATTVWAMKGMDHSDPDMSGEKMDHSSMTLDSGTKSGNFKHVDMADGIHATFQIMSLASMKMKDTEGKTHHIMVTFSQNNKKMKAVAGDIKAVSPSGKEQVGALKHLGGGMYAANYTFEENGEWIITCHFKDQATNHAIKFMYPHHDM